ncbi:hypothetical protein [Micromonospora sp. NPDC023814]|uniref:hypothetical protein n=1 Tax=Micromonospora sp. NPDC023814 TaxID=3154596 RepID=UPI0034078319
MIVDAFERAEAGNDRIGFIDAAGRMEASAADLVPVLRRLSECGCLRAAREQPRVAAGVIDGLIRANLGLSFEYGFVAASWWVRFA